MQSATQRQHPRGNTGKRNIIAIIDATRIGHSARGIHRVPRNKQPAHRQTRSGGIPRGGNIVAGQFHAAGTDRQITINFGVICRDIVRLRVREHRHPSGDDQTQNQNISWPSSHKKTTIWLWEHTEYNSLNIDSLASRFIEVYTLFLSRKILSQTFAGRIFRCTVTSCKGHVVYNAPLATMAKYITLFCNPVHEFWPILANSRLKTKFPQRIGLH